MREPPESYYRESICEPFAEEEREAFRWRLEALLNGVERIQRMAEREEDASVISQNRLDLCKQAAKLIGDVCGDWVKISENDATDPLDYLALSMRIWQPALAMHDENDYFWDDVISEIERLPYGDEPEIIRPAPRSRGEHQQPAKLAFLRLSALQWAAFLKARDIKPKVYRGQITTAYGSDWEAMRKWRDLASRVLGSDYVERAVARAVQGYAMPGNFPDYFDALVRSGAHYRQLMGLPPAPDALLLEVRTGKGPA